MAPGPDPRLRRLERAGVALLLLAALVVRARDLRAPFDRGVDGFQGSCFALFAVNYERVGLLRHGGYPVFNVDLPPAGHPLYVYPNHPPAVPLLGWASLALLGPDGWDTAWRAGHAPRGAEGALRLPFFLGNALALLALWWALRASDGAQRALLALALAAMLPIGIVCAGLVNYENACVPLLLVALGFHARWIASGRARALAGCALAALAASLVTFTPLFFVPGLVLQALAARGWRAALREGLVLGGATLAPLAAHGLWVRAWVPGAAGSVAERAALLWQPLLDGSAPFAEWSRRQLVRLSFFCTPWILALAGAGLVLALAAAWRARPRAASASGARVSLALPLALGAFLSQLLLYRHTYDGTGALDGQTNFLLNLAPAVAALAAVALDALGRPLARLRGGFAPLVLAAALVGLPAVARAGAIRALWRAPGPADDPPRADGPPTPLPSTAGAEIAEVLPAGAVGLVPAGYVTGPAVSYYAWRTIVGVDEATWAVRLGQVDETLGLRDAPHYLLFPREAPPGVRALIERFRPGLVERFGAPLAQSAHWELWPPEP